MAKATGGSIPSSTAIKCFFKFENHTFRISGRTPMFSGEVWFDSKQGQRAEFKQGQSWFSSLWLVHPSLCRRSTSWQEVPQRRDNDVAFTRCMPTEEHGNLKFLGWWFESTHREISDDGTEDLFDDEIKLHVPVIPRGYTKNLGSRSMGCSLNMIE